MGKRINERSKSMIVNTDIDIDIADREKILSIIKNTPAVIVKDSKVKKHNTGVYFHDIPSNPFNGLCTIDYKDAENLGYFKIDVLNVSLYKGIKNRKHLQELLDKEYFVLEKPYGSDCDVNIDMKLVKTGKPLKKHFNINI